MGSAVQRVRHRCTRHGRVHARAAAGRRAGPACAEDWAARAHAFLAGRRLPYSEVGRGLGANPNDLRYAAPTGTILIRWEGARQPVIWNVPRPNIDPRDARLELARRHLHVFGPTTAEAFAGWAGLSTSDGPATFDALDDELTPVRTPIGDAWILKADEPSIRSPVGPTAPARLLPSGDAHFLLHGLDRELLVPDPERRARLWTTRVRPGALLVDGEIVGTWRRAGADLSIETWPRLTLRERGAVEAEANSLPLPGITGPIRVRWAT